MGVSHKITVLQVIDDLHSGAVSLKRALQILHYLEACARAERRPIELIRLYYEIISISFGIRTYLNQIKGMAA